MPTDELQSPLVLRFRSSSGPAGPVRGWTILHEVGGDLLEQGSITAACLSRSKMFTIEKTHCRTHEAGLASSD